MGRLTLTIADYDAEVSTLSVNCSDLTAANIDGEYADAISFQTAVDGVSRGLILKRTHTAKVSMQAVGKSNNQEAQREEKALVMYYDSVTFEKATAEIPAVDMTLQLPGNPGVFFIDGDGNENAAWTAFVSAFEAFVTGPGGNASVVERIIHVGRNL